MNFTVGAFLVGVSMSQAQSMNLDLDEFGGTEQTGNGTPSAAFGAAANQPGYWNRVYAGGPPNATTLSGLDGLPTTCQITASGGIGAYGGYNNPNLSGDFRLLMGDYAWVGGPIQYHFSGFQPGRYLLFTYGADTSGAVKNLYVNVPGSGTSLQTVTGPMPSNQFLYGIDYCAHVLELAGGTFEIDVNTDGFPLPPTQVHGFQIVAVPEPLTIFAFSFGLLGLIAKRKRRM